MKLYHASPFIIELADVYHSCDHLDFGKGFYLTSLYDQARKYAMRFLLKKQKAYINEYLLDDELSDFKIKTFCSYNVGNSSSFTFYQSNRNNNRRN